MTRRLFDQVEFATIRNEFPILTAEPAPGKPSLVYLDSASTTQKPRRVIDALSGFYTQSNANIHRGVYELSLSASEQYEAARATAAAFINASSPDECIFVRNTTEAINLVAQSLGKTSIGVGDLVLTTALEHHSNFVPWQLLAEETGAELAVVEVAGDGQIMFDDLVAKLERRPRILAVTHCSNVLGTHTDIRAIVQAAHRLDVPVLVDGAQAAPHFPVDVQALDCDFFAFSGHKTLGPTGIGVLYGKRERLEALPPFLAGGGMIGSVEDRRSTWLPIPSRFEAGTPAVAEAIALATALDFLSEIGLARVLEHERALAADARRRLRELPGVVIFGPEDERSLTGTISFRIDGYPDRQVAEVLDSQNVAVRTGTHCCQPLMRRLGTDATIRASFYLYNTPTDVDRLLEGVALVLATRPAA